MAADWPADGGSENPVRLPRYHLIRCVFPKLVASTVNCRGCNPGEASSARSQPKTHAVQFSAGELVKTAVPHASGDAGGAAAQGSSGGGAPKAVAPAAEEHAPEVPHASGDGDGAAAQGSNGGAAKAVTPAAEEHAPEVPHASSEAGGAAAQGSSGGRAPKAVAPAADPTVVDSVAARVRHLRRVLFGGRHHSLGRPAIAALGGGAIAVAAGVRHLRRVLFGGGRHSLGRPAAAAALGGGAAGIAAGVRHRCLDQLARAELHGMCLGLAAGR